MAVSHYFKGIRYCRDHYQAVFSQEMENLWRDWEEDCTPSERLQYLIGRWYSEFEIAYEGKPFLTQGIVKFSSFNWKKTKEGAIFTATRRPVVKGSMGTIGRLVYDTWRFNLQSKEYVFLRQRKGELVAI
jgi:hypothetical protein